MAPDHHISLIQRIQSEDSTYLFVYDPVYSVHLMVLNLCNLFISNSFLLSLAYNILEQDLIKAPATYLASLILCASPDPWEERSFHRETSRVLFTNFRHFRHALFRTYPTEKHCLVSLPPTSRL